MSLQPQNFLEVIRFSFLADNTLMMKAIAAHRPYRPALGIGKLLKEITQKKVILCDFVVAKACIRLFIEQSFKL